MASDNGITIGQLTEALNDKADRDLQNMTANIDYVVESKAPTADDPTWYRKYKSGWLEQGGFGKGSVVFLKSYAVAPSMNVTSANTTGDGWPARANNVTNTGFYLYGGNADTITAYWEAKGQGAE